MKKNKIFISIASYRDPELRATIKDCLDNADKPENLVFSIAWQHAEEDTWDQLDDYKLDPRFKIIDIKHSESRGACWARNVIQSNFDDEEYTLQIDSHHRFVPHWDTECINMIKQLKKKGHKKPLLTCYATSYDPENDPEGREKDPWWLTFDRFIPEGAVFFLPATIPGWQDMTEPIPSRFFSAHFVFTLGTWIKEVPYDPFYYFHGEEISLAARSYTHGYDLFHPHRIVVYHEYTRKGRTKQWDDDSDWVNKNNYAHQRNRALFGMDGECSPCMKNSLGPYWFGEERTLEDYERYAGINFKKRAVQQYTLDNKFAPNPVIEDPVEYENSFASIFKHCIDIGFHQVPFDDYTFWAVAFEDENGNEIYRQDADANEIRNMKNDPDGYCKLWRQFETTHKPASWVVWPHSESQGWGERLTGRL